MKAAGAAWRLPAILVLAGLAAYWGIYSSPFVFDDVAAIQANASIRHLGRIGTVLHPPAGGETVTGRPFVNLTLAVNYAIGRLNPQVYHLSNVGIHLLAGLTLFGIVRRTPGKATAAFAIALLWMVHPLQTEAVTYTAQRAESLMGLFYLLTLYCFVRYAERLGSGSLQASRSPSADRPRNALSVPLADPSIVWGGLSIVCCLVGMATKETMVSAPLIVLLYDRTFRAGSFRGALRARGLYYALLGATWIVLIYCVAISGARGGTAGFGVGMSPWRYALFQTTAIAHYLRLCFWPHPLIFDYGTSLSASPGEIAAGCAAVAVLLAATGWALVRRPAWGFLGAWFFMLLAPSSSIVPIATQVMAEHRMYLPVAAVLAAVVCAATTWDSLWLPVSLVAAAILGALTVGRNADYRSARSLWERNVADRPGNGRGRDQLAVLLSEDPALVPEAEAQDEEALRLNPDDPIAHNNLGNILLHRPGRLTDAAAQFRAAVRSDPKSAAYCNNLAAALVRVPGAASEAEAEFKRALRLDPDFVAAHNGLGSLLAGAPGRTEEAIAEFQAALKINPNYAQAHNGLANVWSQMPGKADAAEAEYRAALLIDPDYAEARNNLALLYVQSGRVAEAIRELERVLQINPNLAGARHNLEILRAAASEQPGH